MKASVGSLVLLGLIHLNAVSALAGGLSPTMSWSPDSQWLSFTVVTEPARERQRPGWLFDTAPVRDAKSRWPALDTLQKVAGHSTYQVWTTRRDGQSTVLIEEARWPLSTPAWGSEGRSIAFCRFVPHSIESAAGLPRGRFEVVVQDGLDRKRVVWSEPELELDLDTQAAFPHIRPAWSADGVSLAIPMPGPEPGIKVVRTDNHKLLLALAGASCPAWSPDGTHLACVRRVGRFAKVAIAERQGQGLGAPRDIASTGPVVAYPGWSGDGRSIFVVSERLAGRSHEIDLVRRYLDGGDAIRTISLAPADAVHRGAVLRGITIDFDRDGERCVFSVDYSGRDSALATALPGERQIVRPFNPLDVSQQIGAVAISPDGETIAARFGTSDGLTPPAVCDWNSEQITLLVPDQAAKRTWSARLSAIARDLLVTGLPKVAVDGQAAGRPTLLPLPGELAPGSPIHARVSRIARLGATLDRYGADDVEPTADSSSRPAELETRLFFRYLAGDYPGAATVLDALDSEITTPEQRLATLSVKAQILWGQGERSRARSIIEYIQTAQGAETRRIEETPFGVVVTKELSPGQAWARHLAQQAALPESPKSPNEAAQTAEIPEQPFHLPLVPGEPQPIEGHAGEAPLGPLFRRFDGFDR
jgi:Tol biopolymer transport system component